jgi:hypothetical protein
MRNRSVLGTALATAVIGAGSVLMALTGTPAEAAVGGSGPYPADYETASSLSSHTIYRPQTLPSEKMPIFVWGNGGCSGDGTSSMPFLRQIASYGYLAIANGSPGGGAGTNSQMLTQSIDWAISENSRQGSKYYGRLDTSKIAVAGWSCGGLEAYAVSNDSRISTTMIFSSGLLNDGDDYQLRRLTKPIAYIIGGSGDIAYPNAMDDWGKLPSGLPAFMGNLNVGHGGTYTQTNGGEFGRVAVLWLQWRLRGDLTAGANFVGSGCGLCRSGQWTVQQKNLTLGGGTTTTTTTSTTTTTTRPTTTTTTTAGGGTTSSTTTTPTTTTTNGGGSGGCTAAYAVQSQWNGGFVANIDVKAGSSAIRGWRVSLTLPGGAVLTSIWNGVNSGTSGTVTVTNQNYNGTLAAGQGTNFGFQGTGTGAGATVSCSAS